MAEQRPVYRKENRMGQGKRKACRSKEGPILKTGLAIEPPYRGQQIVTKRDEEMTQHQNEGPGRGGRS